MDRERFNKASQIVKSIIELEKKNEFVEGLDYPKSVKRITQISVVIEGDKDKVVSIILPKSSHNSILMLLTNTHKNLLEQLNEL